MKKIKIIGSVVIASIALLYTYAQVGKGGGYRPPVEQPTNVATEEDLAAPTGDDPWKEMDKLVAAYYGKDGVAYKGTIKLIDDNGEEEKIVEIHPFEYSFFRGSFHYSLDSVEVINQQDYILMVDHRARFASVSEGSGEHKQSGRLFDMNEFKKLMLEQKANAEVTESGNEKMLTIDSIQDPQIQGYRIYYDPQTYKINKMLIGMLRFSSLDENESESAADQTTEDDEINTYSYYVEITYRESRALSLRNGHFNPIEQFLKIEKNRIELQPGYNNYELVNTME